MTKIATWKVRNPKTGRFKKRTFKTFKLEGQKVNIYDEAEKKYARRPIRHKKR
jgi:hypothetical protein